MKNYWHCIVEVDIPEKGLPHGADWPMRIAVERAINDLNGDSEVINIWSGWGLSEGGANNVLSEACKESNTITKEELERR